MPRLDDKLAGAGSDDLVADLCAHPPREDVRVLVFALVRVHRRGERSRRDPVLDQREAAVGVGRFDQVGVLESGEVGCPCHAGMLHFVLRNVKRKTKV